MFEAVTYWLQPVSAEQHAATLPELGSHCAPAAVYVLRQLPQAVEHPVFGLHPT